MTWRTNFRGTTLAGDTRLLRPLVLVLTSLLLAAPASAAAPTDPLAGQQQPLQILRVAEALDRIADPLKDVLVYVPDTGLDLDHPDLQSRLFAAPEPIAAPAPDGGNPGTVQTGAPGWDLIGNAAENTPFQPDADPSDPIAGSGHGTLVSGVLGAAWDNGAGGAGVAPNARFVVLRSCWDNDNCYQYAQAAAIEWAADRGVRVVSMSWLSGLPFEDGFRTAIVDNPGVLFVAIPSGGGGPADADPGSPLPCTVDAPNVLCVSTSSPTDGLSCGWFGATSVDVAVPTENSVTTENGGTFRGTSCATSYAAPTAAGVATILFGIDPTATPADVKAAIMDSARRVPAWEGKSVTGGVVDALAAVNLFQSRRGIAPKAPPAGGQPGPAVPPPPTPQAAPDVTVPRLAFSMTPRRSRAPGRTVRMLATLSEPAALRVVVERALPGRRLGTRCVLPRRSPRARRCTRWARIGSVARALASGTTRIPMRAIGRRGTRLVPGAYRARARATDAAGNASPEQIARFTITAR